MRVSPVHALLPECCGEYCVVLTTHGSVSLAVQSPAASVVIILNPENLADQWPMNNSTMAEKMAMSPPSFPNEESHIMRLGLRTF